MLVRTPIADLAIDIDRLAVENGTLVASNSRNDAMAARAILGPRDVRRVLRLVARPGIVRFVVSCLFRSDSERDPSDPGGREEDEHPTPNPW